MSQGQASEDANWVEEGNSGGNFQIVFITRWFAVRTSVGEESHGSKAL